MNIHKPLIMVTILALGLGGCASPTVNRNAAGFDEDKFAADLNECRGGPFFNALMVGVVVSAWGALEGAAHGAIHGGSSADEGAVIGAAVGGVLGLGIGAVDAVIDRDKTVRACVEGKGYSVL
jgi:hypothetical protein